MAAGGILALVSLILVAGGCLLQFFVILSGATNGGFENKVYFLHADTSNVQGAFYQNTAWTYFAVCGFDGSQTVNCGNRHPAVPFNPPQYVSTSSQGVPPVFLGTHYYYYMSRFAWAFYLMALFFGVIGLFTGLLALCSRLGGYLSGLLVFLAVFFQALAAALMTVWTVKARNVFNRQTPNSAKLGQYAYGFTWGAFACFFISTVLFCVSGTARKDKSGGGGGGMFKRNKSTRSRSSYREDGVKDEYS